jgi:GNAT superfamily N-acetyltransferase
MPTLEVAPLTPERWDDLVELFERPGASVARGCWCMFYGESGKSVAEPGLGLRESRKRALKALVGRGVVPGLIAYRGGRPIGWISLGPRADYAKLARSPVMKPVDQAPVWSIVCFFIDSRERGQGVAEALLKAALAWARGQGVTLVEAYPVDRAVDRARRGADDSMWFGAMSMYGAAGFREVARRKPTRPVVRKRLRPRQRMPSQ